MKQKYELVLDGNSFILEVSLVEKYNAVRSVISRDEEKFYNLCMYLTNLTDIELNAK